MFMAQSQRLPVQDYASVFQDNREPPTIPFRPGQSQVIENRFAVSGYHHCQPLPDIKHVIAATRQVQVLPQRPAHQQASSHTLLATFRQAFNRHTTSKNHGENDSHCQHSAMLIHPSGKLFNPQKVKPRPVGKKTITLAPGLTARLNAQTYRGEDQRNRDKHVKGIANRFAINEVRLMP